MPHTSASPFAARMMERAAPDSCNSDPAHRFFDDPPEQIQIAFGGRPWFFEAGNTRVHRIGLFRGLGWEFDREVSLKHPRRATGVEITKRSTGKDRKFDMVFVQRVLAEDHMEGGGKSIVSSHPGLTLDQLKPAYLAELGC